MINNPYRITTIASRIGVSRHTINSIEANRYVPSTVLALKMARVFELPVEQSFQLEEKDEMIRFTECRQQQPQVYAPFV
jgi:putative transcriptional regulator